MKNIILKILEEISENVLVYFAIVGAGLFGIILHQDIIGLALFSFAIGIAVGQATPK
jgi:hypothetical protein